MQLTENRLQGIRSLLLLARKWLVTGIKLDCSGKYKSETLKCLNHLSSPYHYLWLLTTGVFVIWYEARINFTYRIFYSAHTLWRQYCCVSDWLSAQLFALMHSSQVTFAFRTVCFLTVHATLISILINAQKKCGGNCWLVKANIQTSWPWGHGKFASTVPWDLLWHLIPQLYRHLSSSPAAWPWWTLSHRGWYPMCTHLAAPQTPPHHSLRGCCRQPVKQLWGWNEGAVCVLTSSVDCSLAVV